MAKLRNGALYIRVSTADQTELSPDAQQRLLLDYAKKNGIEIPGLKEPKSDIHEGETEEEEF